MFSTFKTVFKKEFTSIRKNPTAILLACLLPFAFVVFYISLMVYIGDLENTKNETINIALYIKDEDTISNVYDSDVTDYHDRYIFIKDNILKEDYYSFVKTDDAFADYLNGKIDLILTIDKDISDVTNNNIPVDIYYNPSDDSALRKLTFVLENINLYSTAISEYRLNAIGSSFNDITPVVLNSSNLSEFFSSHKVEGLNDTLLSSALPSCVICFIAFGGLAFGSEMFVMEKEKGTLEVLLATNSNRTQILLGKITVHVLFSLLTLISEILGLVIGYFINYSYLSKINIFFSAGSIFAMLFTLATVSILCSIISATVFVFSKNSKTANIGQSTVSIIPSFLSVFLIVLKKSTLNNIFFRFIPILNSLFSFKLSIMGFVSIPNLIVSGVINLSLCALLIFASIRRFNSERILSIN